MMNVLIACEESQRVCIEFRKKGHNAYSCDIQECSGGHPEWHILGDCLPLLNGNCTFTTMTGRVVNINSKWDLIIAHPPCTYLTPAGACNIPKHPERIQQGFKAKEFFMSILNADCDSICVENPPPMKRFNLPPYTQIITPNMFGHPIGKKTSLWLKGLHILQATNLVEVDHDVYSYVRRVDGKKMTLSRWYQQANDGKNWSKNRSKTFPGIAKAMAEQWG